MLRTVADVSPQLVAFVLALRLSLSRPCSVPELICG